MSVLVTVKFPGDTDAFRRFISNRADPAGKISEQSKSQGAIHHRFGIGDGFVVAIDEWESVEAFNGFSRTTPTSQPSCRRAARRESRRSRSPRRSKPPTSSSRNRIAGP